MLSAALKKELLQKHLRTTLRKSTLMHSVFSTWKPWTDKYEKHLSPPEIFRRRRHSALSFHRQLRCCWVRLQKEQSAWLPGPHSASVLGRPPRRPKSSTGTDRAAGGHADAGKPGSGEPTSSPLRAERDLHERRSPSPVTLSTIHWAMWGGQRPANHRFSWRSLVREVLTALKD